MLTVTSLLVKLQVLAYFPADIRLEAVLTLFPPPLPLPPHTHTSAMNNKEQKFPFIMECKRPKLNEL